MKRHTTNRNWTKWLAATALALALLGTSAHAEMVDGFVTRIDSPTEFNVGTLHVVMDGETQCKTETLHSDIHLRMPKYQDIFAQYRYGYSLQDRASQSGMLPAPCRGFLLKTGTRVQIEGDIDPHSGYYSAVRVVKYKTRIRQIFSRASVQSEWEGGALLEEEPQVTRTTAGWAGTLWLDGYPMSISPDTKLLTAPRGTRIIYAQYTLLSSPRVGTNLNYLKDRTPKFSASLFQANTWATYQSLGPINGHVPLYRIRLWPNQIDLKREKHSKKFSQTVQVPDYRNHIPGSVKFPHIGGNQAFKILPDQDVQDFVSNLGLSLVPQYQKELPDAGATKIHFRFYVVQPYGTHSNGEMRKIDAFPAILRVGWDKAVGASPDGLIVISENALAKINNKAEMALLLSCGITSVLQKYSDMPVMEYQLSVGTIYGNGSYQPYIVLRRNEQALRIGIRQMYLAGYDIREAPYAWAVAQGKSVQNPIINSKHPDQEIPWYAAYAFNYISHYYSDVDYSKLKRGEREYQQFLQELYKADPSLPRPKALIQPQAQTQ